jgi:cobalt-zinc-cadmium efflux system outer membrane protein
VGAQRARAEALASQLQGELSEHLTGFEAARRNDALISSRLLPQAEVSFQSAVAGYESGRIDFATVLEAQRQIRKAKSERLKSQVEAQLHLADIERLVGEDL